MLNRRQFTLALAALASTMPSVAAMAKPAASIEPASRRRRVPSLPAAAGGIRTVFANGTWTIIDGDGHVRVRIGSLCDDGAAAMIVRSTPDRRSPLGGWVDP